ncbi:hypothetical protein EJB05_12721, partial [Eragrostis curvula]
MVKNAAVLWPAGFFMKSNTLLQSYSRMIGLRIHYWSHNIVQVPEMDIGSIQEWWNKNVERVPKDQKRLKAAVMIYTAWHIWNERNRRIFTSTALQPSDVARMIREDMSLSQSLRAPAAAF